MKAITVAILLCALLTMLLTGEGAIDVKLVALLVAPVAITALAVVLSLRFTRTRRRRAPSILDPSTNQVWTAAAMKFSLLESVHGKSSSTTYLHAAQLHHAVQHGEGDLAATIQKFSQAVDRFEASVAQ